MLHTLGYAWTIHVWEFNMKEALVKLLELHVCSAFSANYSVDGRICIRCWMTLRERMLQSACLWLFWFRFELLDSHSPSLLSFGSSKTYPDFDRFLLCSANHDGAQRPRCSGPGWSNLTAPLAFLQQILIRRIVAHFRNPKITKLEQFRNKKRDSETKTGAIQKPKRTIQKPKNYTSVDPKQM